MLLPGHVGESRGFYPVSHPRDTQKTAFYQSQKSFELGLVQLVVHLLNLRDENPPKTWSFMVSSSW